MNRATLTTYQTHGIESGDFVLVDGKTYRVVAVSSTTMVIDRPWWMPLHVLWRYLCVPLAWVRSLWRRF